MAKDNKTSTICKIIYFDEESVTDYVQIVAGGELEKTTELLRDTSAAAGGKLDAQTKAGISGVFRAILGFEASASVSANASTSINTNKIAKNIVKNTILTDFLGILEEDSLSSSLDVKSKEGSIRKFQGYKISAEKNSMAYMAMVSPYLSMLQSDSSISAGEFNIAIDKMDGALKNAKGYYEFVGTKGRGKVVLRFNIGAFRNNYRISDLLKMNLSIYAIKVGKTSLDKLDFNTELDIENTMAKSNPTYSSNDKADKKDVDHRQCDVYDVLLAGVEADG